MEVTMKHTGSCLCKRIAYEVDGEFEDFYLCHCSRCRKDTGSSHAANLFSSTAKLTWISGEELVKTYEVEGTHHAKSFCPNCGSALPMLQMEGSLLVVPAGSLDSDLHISPKGHIYMESRAPWDNNSDKIPEYPQQPVPPEKF
jgi:hypothetical protein